MRTAILGAFYLLLLHQHATFAFLVSGSKLMETSNPTSAKPVDTGNDGQQSDEPLFLPSGGDSPGAQARSLKNYLYGW